MAMSNTDTRLGTEMDEKMKQNYAAIAALLTDGRDFHRLLKEGRVKLTDKATGANPEPLKTAQ